eukprot:CAMPEP_0178724750 /NCGR_PEP_ID=MMETSP0699-20121125/26272_1 /TAXON_ID=265572 /ORGANISM="Extubocellulus spinifer, Strain CCMP396" /LENGTH=184 /DNA_ID=CAMNT_0020375969 /DNA_START=14 /DNA_END=568 /DNA_ORIENTATION=-
MPESPKMPKTPKTPAVTPTRSAKEPARTVSYEKTTDYPDDSATVRVRVHGGGDQNSQFIDELGVLVHHHDTGVDLANMLRRLSDLETKYNTLEAANKALSCEFLEYKKTEHDRMEGAVGDINTKLADTNQALESFKSHVKEYYVLKAALPPSVAEAGYLPAVSTSGSEEEESSSLAIPQGSAEN